MHHISLPFAFAVVMLLLAAPCKAEKYALVVGVNQCNNYIVPGRNPPDVLEGAEDNAKDFGKMLQSRYGFIATKIHLLLGKDATYDAVAKEMTWFKDNIKSKDITGSEHRFAFFFAGHGTQVPDIGIRDEGKADGLDEALCPFDAVVHKGIPDRLIVDDELNNWLQDIPAREITVVLDCCHAGTAAKGSKGENEDRILERSAPGVAQNNFARPWKDFGQRRTGPRKRIIALYACDAGQPAIERFFPAPVNQLRGQFTQLLIEHLSKPGSSDKLGELSKATKSEIDTWANANMKLRSEAGKQTPTFEPEEEQDRELILP